MTRRVIEHAAISNDRERLTIVTVFEPGINKEQVKKMNRFSKRHHVLIKHNGNYDWK